MTEQPTERNFDGRAEASDEPNDERTRTGPTRRTFLKSTGAVASATAFVDATNTARAAIPEKPDAVDTMTASAAVLAQTQSVAQCGSGKITFANQASNGSRVVVDSVTLSAGGFVDIHDDRLSDAPTDALASIIGVSGYLTPGINRDVVVPLFDVPGKTFDRTALDADQTLTAMAHHDTDADEEYDFAVFNGAEDRPYLNDDASTVSDSAMVTVATGPQRNTLTIRGSGSYASYAFTVSGDLAGESLTGEDDITGSSATGAVGPGEDRYTFTGTITSFDLNGNATVLVNGEEIDTSKESTLTIRGSGSYASYAFTVSGDLAGESLTREDDITGSSATGAVGPGEDRYTFTGTITSFDLNGNATVLVNGEEIDTTTIPSNRLSIEGSGRYTSYAFAVSGDLNGESLTREDDITGSSATGAVGPGTDVYYFSGEFTRFDLDGGATVRVNGKEIDPAHPNTVAIQGSGSFARYSFAVDGEIVPRRGLSGEDSISRDGTSATGAVRPGTDSYAYSGTITSFTLDGRATVLVNDTSVDPIQL